MRKYLITSLFVVLAPHFAQANTQIDSKSLQTVVNKLQAQITEVQKSMTEQVKQQFDMLSKNLEGIKSNTNKELIKLPKQIKTVEAQLSAEIKKVTNKK